MIPGRQWARAVPWWRASWPRAGRVERGAFILYKEPTPAVMGLIHPEAESSWPPGLQKVPPPATASGSPLQRWPLGEPFQHTLDEEGLGLLWLQGRGSVHTCC